MFQTKPCMHTLHAFCSLCVCAYLQVLTHACMCPPPAPHPPHFIIFDDLFPAEVDAFAPLLKSTATELLHSFARGRFFFFFRDLSLTTSGVHVWFIVVWKTTVSDAAGIFMSSAYKADFGYYGKSSKNSWNWRYAAWRLRASLVFQRSEIFLNFATQPSLHPNTPPPPRTPAQIQSPDLLHPVTVCREEQGGSSKAARVSENSWKQLPGAPLSGEDVWNLGSALHDSQTWNVAAKSVAVYPQACL